MLSISMRLTKFGHHPSIYQLNPFTNHTQSRLVRIERLSNKRVTRIQSDIELSSPDFRGRIVNRNPRNMELMSLEKKPEGYWLEKAPFLSHNRLVYKQTGRHQYAYLQHWSGKKLIQASTQEQSLAKYYNNPGTSQATAVIAQVITRRCLQSGYLCAEVGTHDDRENMPEKSKIFYDTAEACGFSLEELPEIHPRSVIDP